VRRKTAYHQREKAGDEGVGGLPQPAPETFDQLPVKAVASVFGH
jgi:hypothetical protein